MDWQTHILEALPESPKKEFLRKYLHQQNNIKDLILKVPYQNLYKYIVNKENLLLVFDLCQLTKGEKSDSSICSTHNEIMQAIRSSSMFYIKAYVLHRYHQIPLS